MIATRLGRLETAVEVILQDGDRTIATCPTGTARNRAMMPCRRTCSRNIAVYFSANGAFLPVVVLGGGRLGVVARKLLGLDAGGQYAVLCETRGI